MKCDVSKKSKSMIGKNTYVVISIGKVVETTYENFDKTKGGWFWYRIWRGRFNCWFRIGRDSILTNEDIKSAQGLSLYFTQWNFLMDTEKWNWKYIFAVNKKSQLYSMSIDNRDILNHLLKDYNLGGLFFFWRYIWLFMRVLL